MREILDESDLPTWVVDELKNDRTYYKTIGVTTKPTTLGSDGWKIYHIKNDWYGWAYSGALDFLISDGRKDINENVRWICVRDLLLYTNKDGEFYDAKSVVEICGFLIQHLLWWYVKNNKQAK